MSSVGLSEVTTTHTTGSSQSTARASQRRGQHEPLSVEPAGGDRAIGPQYSVWPRRSRNWSTEKTRMTANSTHAMADAEPKWKKFWKAVS